MGDSPRSRRRPRLILLASCAAVALLLTACFDEGHPTSFDDTVETNFLNGCELAAEADPQIRPVAPRYCVCAYERVRAEMSFEDFKSLDDDVRDEPDRISNDDEESAAAQLTAIFNDCRATHARG